MNDKLPEPLWDLLLIEPVVDEGLLGKTLNHYAKVLAVGPDVKTIVVGDYVAFEKWDKPEFPVKERVFHLLPEKFALCKVPLSWI